MTNQIIAGGVVSLALIVMTLDYWFPRLWEEVWRASSVAACEHVFLPLLDWLIGDEADQSWKSED